MDRNWLNWLFFCDICVVPYVGTWIEIVYTGKSVVDIIVVPYVGTWIEICQWSQTNLFGTSRSLRGNVDRNSYFGNL